MTSLLAREAESGSPEVRAERAASTRLSSSSAAAAVRFGDDLAAGFWAVGDWELAGGANSNANGKQKAASATMRNEGFQRIESKN